MKDYRNQEMKNLSLMLCFLFLIWCTPALSFSMATEEQSRYEAISFLLESSNLKRTVSSVNPILTTVGLSDWQQIKGQTGWIRIHSEAWRNHFYSD